MFRKLVAPAMICLFVITSFASQTAGEWQKLTPPDQSFSVLMPSPPEKQDDKKETQYGPVVTQIWISRIPSGATAVIYLVGITDYPIDVDPKTELGLDRDNFLKAVNANLVSSTNITVGTVPGMEFVGKSTTHTFKSVVFLKGRRVFQVVAGEISSNIDEDRVEKFLRSFELAKKP